MGEFTGLQVSFLLDFEQLLRMLLVALQLQALLLPTKITSQTGPFSFFRRLQLVDSWYFRFKSTQPFSSPTIWKSSTCKTGSTPLVGFRKTPGAPFVSW